jgi:hypothetical protein
LWERNQYLTYQCHPPLHQQLCHHYYAAVMHYWRMRMKDCCQGEGRTKQTHECRRSNYRRSHLAWCCQMYF